jgi:hypothetical protein
MFAFNRSRGFSKSTSSTAGYITTTPLSLDVFNGPITPLTSSMFGISRQHNLIPYFPNIIDRGIQADMNATNVDHHLQPRPFSQLPYLDIAQILDTNGETDQKEDLGVLIKMPNKILIDSISAYNYDFGQNVSDLQYSAFDASQNILLSDKTIRGHVPISLSNSDLNLNPQRNTLNGFYRQTATSVNSS